MGGGVPLSKLKESHILGMVEGGESTLFLPAESLFIKTESKEKH